MSTGFTGKISQGANKMYQNYVVHPTSSQNQDLATNITHSSLGGLVTSHNQGGSLQKDVGSIAKEVPMTNYGQDLQGLSHINMGSNAQGLQGRLERKIIQEKVHSAMGDTGSGVLSRASQAQNMLSGSHGNMGTAGVLSELNKGQNMRQELQSGMSGAKGFLSGASKVQNIPSGSQTNMGIAEKELNRFSGSSQGQNIQSGSHTNMGHIGSGLQENLQRQGIQTGSPTNMRTAGGVLGGLSGSTYAQSMQSGAQSNMGHTSGGLLGVSRRQNIQGGSPTNMRTAGGILGGLSGSTYGQGIQSETHTNKGSIESGSRGKLQGQSMQQGLHSNMQSTSAGLSGTPHTQHQGLHDASHGNVILMSDRFSEIYKGDYPHVGTQSNFVNTPSGFSDSTHNQGMQSGVQSNMGQTSASLSGLSQGQNIQGGSPANIRTTGGVSGALQGSTYSPIMQSGVHTNMVYTASGQPRTSQGQTIQGGSPTNMRTTGGVLGVMPGSTYGQSTQSGAHTNMSYTAGELSRPSQGRALKSRHSRHSSNQESTLHHYDSRIMGGALNTNYGYTPGQSQGSINQARSASGSRIKPAISNLIHPSKYETSGI